MEPTVRQRSNAQLIREFWPWLSQHRGPLGIACLLMLCCTALFQAGPLLVRRAVDVDLLGRSVSGLYVTVALFVGAQALYLYLNYLQRMVLERVGQRIVTDIKQRLFDRVLGLSLSFFDREPVGRLISRIESDSDALRQVFTFTAVVLLGDMLKLIVAAGIMLWIQPALALVVLSTLILVVGVSVLFERIGRPVFRAARERNADVLAFLEERLHAMPVLQAFGQEARTRREMDLRNRDKFRMDSRSYLIWNTFWNVILLIETTGLCLALGYGGWLVLRGAITIGTVLMFTEFLRRFFEPVFRLSEQLGVLQKAFASGERVFDLLEVEGEVPDPAEPRPFEGLRSSLSFERVTFGYSADAPVLKDVSFEIPRGEHWAIVGPTGGGKTTIVSLALRFYDPQEGAVRVDGVDVRELRQSDLRARCALVLQDVVVFPGTVRENLVLGNAAVDEAALREAIREASALELIEALPQGWDTPLNDRGSNLSTGQRQLLSFARALARDPELLILDEATASIDPSTERTIQEAMRRLLAGRTALIVAHRLSTVRDADRILVVEGGRIVEQGTHDQLVARDGPYRRLHFLQSTEAAAVAS